VAKPSLLASESARPNPSRPTGGATTGSSGDSTSPAGESADTSRERDVTDPRTESATTKAGRVEAIDRDEEEPSRPPPDTGGINPFFANPHKSNGHPHVDTITGLLDLPDDIYRRHKPGPESESSTQRTESRRPGRHRRDDE
jgi:hypothetical protein